MITNFFNNAEIPRLIFNINAGGALVPSVEFPNTKTKSTYFIRKKKDVVIWENFREVLTFGDMSARPVDELAVLVEEAFCPLLTNAANQEGWPKVVKEDIALHVYSFRNNVYQVKYID